MSDDLQPSAGPDKTWAWRGHKLGVYHKTETTPRWWEFTGADGLGSHGRGPLRAFVGWLKWRRQYAARPWYKQN